MYMKIKYLNDAEVILAAMELGLPFEDVAPSVMRIDIYNYGKTFENKVSLAILNAQQEYREANKATKQLSEDDKYDLMKEHYGS